MRTTVQKIDVQGQYIFENQHVWSSRTRSREISRHAYRNLTSIAVDVCRIVYAVAHKHKAYFRTCSHKAPTTSHNSTTMTGDARVSRAPFLFPTTYPCLHSWALLQMMQHTHARCSLPDSVYSATLPLTFSFRRSQASSQSVSFERLCSINRALQTSPSRTPPRANLRKVGREIPLGASRTLGYSTVSNRRHTRN